jgi:hypothetical protein
MPNAIYLPHWHTVPPSDHPVLGRWLTGLLVVLLLVLSLG